MTQYELMLLLELDAGCYHSCMCGRSGNDKTKALATFDNLIKKGYIELIGDEYLLTIDGTDIISVAMINVNEVVKQCAPHFADSIQQIGPIV